MALVSIWQALAVSENGISPLNGSISDSGDAHFTDHKEPEEGVGKGQKHIRDIPNHAAGDTGGTTDEDDSLLEQQNDENIPDITIDDDGNFLVTSIDEQANETNKGPPKDSAKSEKIVEMNSYNEGIEQTEDNKINSECESKTVSNTENESQIETATSNTARSKDGESGEDRVNNSERTEEDLESEEGDEKKEDDNEPLDILGNGLLLKQVIKASADPKCRPTYGDRVTVRSEGTLENGAVIDKHDSITFTLGDGDVIQAWDLCTALMGVGEVCQLTTGAKYAYGQLGRLPEIPAHSKITYTLELLKKEDGLDLTKLSVAERLQFGDRKRERGNFLFGRNDYSGAINSYSKALKILNDDNLNHSEDVSLLQQLVDTRVKCFNNMGAAQIKVEAYDAAIKSCDEVLKVQPQNVKALFRKGKSHAAKGSTEIAISVLKKAVQLDPESKIVQQELFKQTKKLKKEMVSEKEMYMKMFGSSKSSDEKKKSSGQWMSWGWAAIGGVSAVLLSLGIAAYRNMQN